MHMLHKYFSSVHNIVHLWKYVLNDFFSYCGWIQFRIKSTANCFLELVKANVWESALTLTGIMILTNENIGYYKLGEYNQENWFICVGFCVIW